MKILFISDSFNGMAQRLWIELDKLNHDVRLCISASANEMIEAVLVFEPKIIIAPFLTSRIPKEIYERLVCLVVHPGVIGDRGASSLDWAILNEEKKWGVTILQAEDKMDSGDIWASNEFDMRPVSKGELYRNEVAQAAAKGILQSINNVENSEFIPRKLNYSNPNVKGGWQNKISQNDVRFNWHDDTSSIIRKINSLDSSPGVLAKIENHQYYCFGAKLENVLTGNPGNLLAIRDNAICIATSDGALWLTHLKLTEENAIKLPATFVLKTNLKQIHVSELSPFEMPNDETWQQIKFELLNGIGYIHFDFYNGAMSTEQCVQLQKVIIEAKKRTRLIVLMGGRDVWSNGIHLNLIENASSPADESWANINAMNDLILELINSSQHYIISALQGNAGAGGVALALAADKVLARNGIVLNPHTKNMGLYGSEYWTYLLPKRIGIEKATKFTDECLPWGVSISKDIGLIDDFFGETNAAFIEFVKNQANIIFNLPYFDKLLKAKAFQRRKDEMNKPLEEYRLDELSKMKLNFYDNDLGFNHKRHCFVHKLIDTTTNYSSDLYFSRRDIYRKRKWESKSYNNSK